MPAFKKEIREKSQLAKELLEEATQLMYDGKLVLAKTTALRAKELFAEIEEPNNVAAAINTLAVIYEELGLDQLVLSSFLDALEIALDENAYIMSAKIYNNLASSYMDTKTYDRALAYLEKSLEMFETGLKENAIPEKDKVYFLIILYLNLSLVYCIEGNEKKSRYYYNESLTLAAHPWNQKAVLTFQSFEAIINYKYGEIDIAKAKIDIALETAKDIRYSTNFMESMSYIFEVLKNLEDYDRWEKALKIMDEHIDDDVGFAVKEEILKYWLEFYKATENVEEYSKGCIALYELGLEKEVEDNQKHAAAIEMETEVRLANREKKQTDQIVYSDTLTKIGNRNKMLEDSQQFIDKSIKEGYPIGIGLLDIDYFKECNDTYGHVAGDECLKRVAAVIRDAVGERGEVYRFGGDEFLVLTYNMEIEEITNLGKTIFDNLAMEKIPNEKSPVSEYVTISQGYTRAFADEGDTIESLVNQVDKVLYYVKRFGRNNYRFMDYFDIE